MVNALFGVINKNLIPGSIHERLLTDRTGHHAQKEASHGDQASIVVNVRKDR